MTDDVLLTLIYDRLYRLGLAASYAGFFHTARAVLLACREPYRLTCVTKWLYPEVADHYGTTWHAVERSIRYSISILWEAHPNRLRDLSEDLLSGKPAPAKFIAMLVAGIENTRG